MNSVTKTHATPTLRLRPCSSLILTCLLLLLSLTACSDDSGTDPGDTTPPAAVSDLSAATDGPGAVILTWTASGDDGREGRAEGHEIRSSRTLLSEASWDSATLVAAARPSEPGTAQSKRLQGLASGAWYFALQTSDASGNRSPISNVASVDVLGLAPPAPVTDLAIGDAGDRTVRLTWTAPQTSGEDPATDYDIRYGTELLTEANFAQAMSVADPPSPAAEGVAESFSVTGLEPATQYFFALRSSAQPPNWSAISNVVEVSTDNIVRLTTSAGLPGSLGPDWSPDGTRIAYAFKDNPNPPQSRLFWKSVTGGAAVQLTNGTTTAANPSWSPDGTEIAFVLERNETTDGGTVSYLELAVMPATPNGIPTVIASHGRGQVQGISWSPDGTELVYAVSVSFPPPVREVYIVSRSGGEPRLLLDSSIGVSSSPDWSPDGSRILFSTDGDLWSVAPTGGAPIRITDTPEESEGGPRWSPDGSRIAYSSSLAGNSDVWVMSADGGDRVQVTSDPADEFSSAWSPDGRAIAFVRTLPYDIWLVYLEP